jgi:4-diphosphocytidyl-2-C-methyl-D-erythritol kinase
MDAPWPAPAKLNLFLHVTGQRDDGYHLLQTLFQFLDYSDLLSFILRNDGKIVRASERADLPVEQDLCVRAACLLQQHTQVSQGVVIDLDKRLPMGGGLGGGSSDAATVLVALNQLWQTGLSLGELARLGLQLGADVPVFVHGQAAWAEGVGEQLTSVTLDEPWFVVLVPPLHVSTQEVFSDPDLTRNSTPIALAQFLAGSGRNDCEAVVGQRYPQVQQALEWLSQFAPARMTGTGACVFAAFAQEQQAREVVRQLALDKVQTVSGMRGFVARGCNRSPLLDRLSAEIAADTGIHL